MTTLIPPRYSYVAITIVTAAVAALAAGASVALALPVWAMFVGWIAFFTRGMTARSAVENLACVGLGILIGSVAAIAIPQVATIAGPAFAGPIVAFAVALLVVSARGLSVMSNLLCYFLGLVTWFAAHLEPSLESIANLFGATGLGSFAGWVSLRLPSRFGSAH